MNQVKERLDRPSSWDVIVYLIGWLAIYGAAFLVGLVALSWLFNHVRITIV
jgi:hypothetical protein